MPLLIDCYNVLHAPMPAMIAGLDEAGLCRALGRTAWRGGGITVVCDGQAGPLGLLESPVEGVDLVYSGRGRTADDVIIEMIAADSSPRRLIVVSTDHAIRKAARRRRATAWTSDQFIHQLVAALGASAGRCHGTFPVAGEDKPAGDLDDEETRRWLRVFGLDEA